MCDPTSRPCSASAGCGRQGWLVTKYNAYRFSVPNLCAPKDPPSCDEQDSTSLGDGSHSCVRSRKLLHNVQPVRTPPHCSFPKCHPYASILGREPVGTHLIQVCGTTPCQLNGAEAIIQTITDHVGIKAGGEKSTPNELALT